MVSTLSWIVFLAVLFTVYLSNTVINRFVYKKWNFRVSLLLAAMALANAFFAVAMSGTYADEYVKNNVEHHWEERIISVQNVRNVVRNREQEGNFFFGCGNTRERETLRYTIINEDGTYSRDKKYTAECILLKTDKQQKKIVFVRNVRVYKNPLEQKFFKNNNDVSDGFYKVHIL
jgi:hypothetical protein